MDKSHSTRGPDETRPVRRVYVEPTITPLGTAEGAQATIIGGSL